MNRGVIIGFGCCFLTACSGIAPVTGGTSAPTVSAPVVGGPSDGNAVPLAVIMNLPQGISATSVREDASGCFNVLMVGDATVPVTGPGGNQICRS